MSQKRKEKTREELNAAPVERAAAVRGVGAAGCGRKTAGSMLGVSIGPSVRLEVKVMVASSKVRLY